MGRGKIMLAAALAAVAVGFAAAAAASVPEGWTDDLDAALKRAQAQKKLVLVNFTGSDWCRWCRKLEEEVFAKPAFRTAAKSRFELVWVDSPKDAKLLSPAAAERNPKLVEKYKVETFPTILVLDGKGTKLAQLGYEPGGAEKYLAALETAVKLAPLAEKFLAPLEQRLAAGDGALRAELEALGKRLEKELAAPEDATEQQKKKRARRLQRELGRAMCAEVLPRHLKNLESMLEKARTTEVPPELKPKLDELVSKREAALELMRKMIEGHAMREQARKAKKSLKPAEPEAKVEGEGAGTRPARPPKTKVEPKGR